MIEGSILGGRFLCKRKIGSGGMGAVYEGEHLELGKRVAIKVLDPVHARSAEFTARFRREAQAASRVESEHTVQVFDVGQDETFGLYIVMEYLSGEDLAARLSLGKPLDVVTTIAIGYQLAEALAKAHAAGVVHRDLKPANVFLQHRDDGLVHVKVLDFGISKLDVDRSPGNGQPTSASGLTGKGIVLGTPQYMSPEQVQGLRVDHRTDVWALGAVLYECVAGVPAYAEKSSYAQMIIRIATTEPKPLAEVAPWVPSPVADVIHEALTAELDKRIPDCSAFARKLRDAAPPGMLFDRTSFPPPAESSSAKAVVRVQSPAWSRADSDAPTLTQGELEPSPTRPKPLVKGTSFLHDEEYIVDKYGPEVWARVLAAMPAGDAEVRASVIAVGWYDNELLVRMLCAAEDVLRDRDPKIIETLGRYAAEADLKRIHRVFLRMANPAVVLEKATALWRRFFNTGRWEVKRVTQGAEAELIDAGVVHEIICRNLRAYVQRLFELVGAKGVTVRHPECRACGAARCVFSVRWRG